jgi:hypothetical protein
MSIVSRKISEISMIYEKGETHIRREYILGYFRIITEMIEHESIFQAWITSPNLNSDLELIHFLYMPS